MSLLKLPSWIQPHLFHQKEFKELSEDEISSLRTRISNFKHEDPEVSVVIPAWNEENNIFRALSSIAANETLYKVEILVINNNSTDQTQKVLDEIGVKNFFEPKQGISYARQCGLEKALGKYYLCADCDTFYPPKWIDIMVLPMIRDARISGVYGRYSFIPPEGQRRFGLWLYEMLTGILIRIRKKNREYLNALGFNMGFVTEIGRTTGGFKVNQARKFDNASGSSAFVEESEDGTMAVNILKKGRLELVTNDKARVFTSPRRLLQDGGIGKAFLNRIKGNVIHLNEFITGKSND